MQTFEIHSQDQLLQILAELNGQAGEDRPDVLLRIYPGRYQGPLTFEFSDAAVEGMGEAEDVVFTGSLGAREILEDGIKRGTFRTQTVYIHGDRLTFQNLTFENTAGDGDVAGQALAVYADGDELEFENCRFLGRQDTLFCAPLPEHEVEPGGFRGPGEFRPRTPTHQHYQNCYIEGTVDFIFGGAEAIFDRCEIFSCLPEKYKGQDKNCDGKRVAEVQLPESGHNIAALTRASQPQERALVTAASTQAGQPPECGYITVASTPAGQKRGFVFRDCRLTGNCPPGSVYLGRPWRENAKTAYIKCWMGAHIHPEGWKEWNGRIAAGGVTYAEYHSTGPGALISARLTGTRQFSDVETEELLRD